MHQHTLHRLFVSRLFWTVNGAHAVLLSEYELGCFMLKMDGVWSTAQTIEGAISEKAEITAFEHD